ncbi:MAG: 8-oxoguanine DNA glycosylase, N-terminal domain-containing protein [Holosporaceae bacterium]|nr:8-oxoguanine DNA glycosylase, N-terminal domain-containing protein [Holosporaceae bacterium]
MQLKEYLDGSRQIFDLGRDYGKIKANIRAIGDPYLTAAVDYGYGIRILRQELWETIVTFLISQ